VRDILEKLADGAAERRYSALKELTDRALILQLRDQLVDVCLCDCWGPNRSEGARALNLLWPDRDVREAFRVCLEAEPYVANTVVELLAGWMDEEAIHLLRTRYRTAENAKMRYSILQAFCKAAQGQIVEFVLGMQSYLDEDERIRALSLSLLARSADPLLKSLYVARLKDESQRVRATAVEALSAICGPEEILSLLPPCLEDTSNRVQANALIPLLRSGYRLAEARLREMISHTSRLFRSSAAYVLGEMPPSSQVTLQLDRLVRDQDPDVRYRAMVSAERLAQRLALVPAIEAAPGQGAA
jgi:HEAT repeat protein